MRDKRQRRRSGPLRLSRQRYETFSRPSGDTAVSPPALRGSFPLFNPLFGCSLMAAKNFPHQLSRFHRGVNSVARRPCERCRFNDSDRSLQTKLPPRFGRNGRAFTQTSGLQRLLVWLSGNTARNEKGRRQIGDPLIKYSAFHLNLSSGCQPYSVMTTAAIFHSDQKVDQKGDICRHLSLTKRDAPVPNGDTGSCKEKGPQSLAGPRADERIRGRTAIDYTGSPIQYSNMACACAAP